MKKKINIIFGPSENDLGGISALLKSYKKSFLLKKINSVLITTYRSDANKLVLIIIFFNAVLKFIKNLIKYKVEIVNLQMASNGSFFRKSIIIILCNILNIKYFVHIHGGAFINFYKKSSFIIKYLIRFVLLSANKIIVCSKFFQKDLKKIIKIKAKIVVINNSINDNFKKIKVNENKNNYILFLANLTPQKGIDDIFKISNDLISKNNNIKFVLCGRDKQDYYYNNFINNRNKSNFVFFNYLRGKKKIDFLKRSKIFILPSYIENSPISIIEAMSASIPIISTNISGIPEQIIHNKNGFLIKPGDTNMLKKYINILVKNKTLASKMGKEGRIIFKNKFSNDISYKKLISLYKI
jgi:glycosyltransferase involved in cell wall biosynthesis